MTNRFHETQIELVRRVAREAQADRQLVVTAFADTFVPLAYTMAPAAFDDSNLRLPHTVDGAQHEKDRAHNRQIVDRWLKGAVQEFPIEFIEPWVAALPEDARERALTGLFARFDRIPAKKLRPEDGLAQFGEVLEGFSDFVESSTPVIADGKIDEADTPHAKRLLLAINRLQSDLSTYEAQVIRILPDEKGASVTSIRSNRA